MYACPLNSLLTSSRRAHLTPSSINSEVNQTSPASVVIIYQKSDKKEVEL